MGRAPGDGKGHRRYDGKNAGRNPRDRHDSRPGRPILYSGVGLAGSRGHQDRDDGKGDRARWLRRDDSDKDSFSFLLLNSNKKSTTLDLRDPKAKDLFNTLIKDADILAENRGPGAMDRLGLGYDDLKEIGAVLRRWPSKHHGLGTAHVQY